MNSPSKRRDNTNALHVTTPPDVKLECGPRTETTATTDFYKQQSPLLCRQVCPDFSEAKRMKKVCNYGDKCYRRNPMHFSEYSHPHLEHIIDAHDGGEYPIPNMMISHKNIVEEQLDIIVQNNFYVKGSNSQNNDRPSTSRDVDRNSTRNKDQNAQKFKGMDYRPMVPPTRQPEAFLKVVAPKGKMAEKHAKSAPYYIFYTTITSARETHNQPLSITFQELLDISLGELKSSLQINFMVEIGWLLAQYYFAGYSEKRLTILYGEECDDMEEISLKKPNVDAHHVNMRTPFGKHHTKMMILCYEDGSLRVVVSTANLYYDDWENRTQGLWMSPNCPELPETSMPFEGESPTGFKKSLLQYLNYYRQPELAYYVERVQRCDFSNINVFLVASVPGSHSDSTWGMTCMGGLLKQHCVIPTEEHNDWDLITQASSIGSYGKEAKDWLTGDFLRSFCKTKDQPQQFKTKQPDLKMIYPSSDNVKKSHDGLLGGGCLPYAGFAHRKQLWLNEYLYQWKAVSSHRDRAMPHIKTYARVSQDGRRAAYYLLTSANISKAAWGTVNKTNAKLRIMSYEAGVLFLPKFLINQDYFSIDKTEDGSLYIPYDLPPTKYEPKMTPWISDYLSDGWP